MISKKFIAEKFVLANAVALALISLSGCNVGPDYVRPTTLAEAGIPKEFKENWKAAQPQDHEIPAKWWTIFNDDNLNTLIEQVATSNLTLAQAEANYRAASALVDNAKAAYFPSLTGNLSRTRSNSLMAGTTTVNSVGVAASWEVDLWGSVRRAVEVQENTALSSFANVQATRLSMQSQLAQNYFQLRVLDAQKELLERTVEEYRRSLTLTQNQYKSGVVATDSVLLAETQLQSTEAQALEVGIQRAQLEHAIAILIGKTPASFSIAAIPIGTTAYMPEMPEIPVGVPSSLLERRPDVAASERSVAAANAQIGVTKAAYFPNLTLGGSGGYQSSTLANWISLPNRVWSVGPALAATLFDGGAKRAQNAQAVAAYDASVAGYRQTVLVAFQNVEDNLASLRILKDEYIVQNAATISARKALAVTMNQYKAGTVNYLNVVTAQTTALTNERSELTITNSRLIAAVQLIAALGGGWNGLDNKDKVAQN
ncbi:efflux transporter outer membrane subunit [Solimicrobium silvestre]|uniref:Efflux transporter, outer membrane factor (OMF) lipoprotein, NodT family n=1 Tax=Solimicrobium silvestre TaxID=2099400 RepID=A0A2S9H1J0_9BURK|nr:efflux transporter outer membrane subunit [Solimicrobium silvestre]PRC93827.1 Efflux transporter, outer membrane factor (OMF) lipoprotein, NodT family [Solimicrobium silvestre]